MKEKIIKILIFLITITNIICILYSIFTDLKGYFLNDEYSTSSSIYIVLIAIILLSAHIFNIIALKKISNKGVKSIVLMILIIMVSVFIPVKEINNEWYDYSKETSNKNGISAMPRTRTVEYKNLYGITLKKKSDTTMSVGPNIE